MARPRFGRLFGSVRLLAAVAGLLLASPATASLTQTQTPPTAMSAQQRDQTWGGCRSVTPDFAIRSCTTLIDAGLEKPAELATALTFRGRAYARKGMVDAAMADFNHGLGVDPTSAELYFERGTLKARQGGDANGAIQDLTRAIELGRAPTPAPYLNRGNAKVSKRDFAGAIADFSRAIEIDPRSAVAYGNRGRAKAAQRDLAGALADLDVAIQIDRFSASNLTSRGLLKSDMADHAGGLVDVNKAVELDSRNHLVLNARGVIKLRMRDFFGAEMDFDATLALAPQHAPAFANRSLSRERRGDVDAALADISRAIELAPSNASYHVGAARLLRMKGDAAGAMAAYGRAIALAPSEGSNYHLRGILKSDERDFGGAVADFREAIKLTPTSDFSYLRLWLVEARIGHRDRASQELKDAVARRRAAQANLWTMTIGDFLVGKVSEAELFKQARDADAETAKDRECEAYFYAGWVKLVDGDAPGAADYFEKSVATGRTRMLEHASAAAERRRGGA